jgi:phosphoglycerate dehydrogenase-like enzyme
MTRVLLYEPAYRRIRDRIADLSGIELLFMNREGEIHEGECEIGVDDARPEVGWATNDLFGGPIRDYMIALLKSPSLRWLQSGAAGFDNPVFAQIVAKGARLTTNHSQSVGMAEYVLTTVLDHFQRGPERRKAQTAREWARLPYREVMVSRWLIVGFGAIGQEVARRARSFGAHITGIRRTKTAHELADVMLAPTDLLPALSNADVVVLSLPLMTDTEALVDTKFLTAMKPTSVLVNVGRGGLVDEAALLEGLDRGAPGHAILDVFRTEPLPADSPFWHHPRVTLSGHASAIGSGLTARTDALFVENLGRYLRGEPLLNEADPADVRVGI